MAMIACYLLVYHPLEKLQSRTGLLRNTAIVNIRFGLLV